MLLPLALSGAVAVGLAVAFVVAVLLEQPAGLRQVSRVVVVATPLAALVALFAYASDPAGRGGAPLARDTPVVELPAHPPRVVSVPPRTQGVSPPAGPAPVAQPVAKPAAKPVAGPVVPLVAPPRVAAPRRAPDRLVPPLPPRLLRAKEAYGPWQVESAGWSAGLGKAYGHAKGKARGRALGHTRPHPPRGR